MVNTEFELDPREVEAFIRPLPARQQLVYRLALRVICPRCRGDRQAHTDALAEQFRNDLPAALKEAYKLGEDLSASASAL
jgi:hypothetical protein